MSYLASLGLSKEQEETLLDLTSEQLREIPPEERINLVLRKHEVEATRRSDFWEGIAALGTVIIPIATFLGIRALWGKK